MLSTLDPSVSVNVVRVPLWGPRSSVGGKLLEQSELHVVNLVLSIL